MEKMTKSEQFGAAVIMGLGLGFGNLVFQIIIKLIGD